MELSPTARMETATPSPNPLPRGRARTSRAIVVAAAAVLFSTTLVLSARASQQQGQAGDTVEPDSGFGFSAVLSTGESVQVYPAARNRADDGIEDHIYLYLPPLTLERDSDGQVLASVARNGRVRVRLRGTSQHITDELHAWLADEGLLPAATRSGSRSVRPLQYDRIRIVDEDYEADARWEAVYPVSTDRQPVAQEWIVFVFTRREGASESPADFADR